MSTFANMAFSPICRDRNKSTDLVSNFFKSNITVRAASSEVGATLSAAV